MDLSASDIIRKLKPRATIVASVGHSRVRPAEYLSPIAQVISNTPARSKACHPFTCHPFMGRIASVESHRARWPLASGSPCNLREIGRLHRDKTALSYRARGVRLAYAG